MQHLLEIVLSAEQLEEAYSDASKEEWKEWKEFYPSSATYLYCQLCHLPM
jgi:hypothetical protein